MNRLKLIFPMWIFNRIRIALVVIISLIFSFFNILYAAQKEALTLYFSADRTTTRASAIAIEQGIKTALSETDNHLGGYPVELKILDHRGSTPRAKKHLQAYLRDPSALVLFSGMHSPPLLTSREYINTRGILVLDPWAAAAPITRYPSKMNWIFRLSVDDSKAGFVITEHAVTQEGVRKPALLLEQTGWGKSNKRTMTKALEERNLAPISVKWFNWGLSLGSARILLREINLAKADAVFLVANTPEAKIICQAMASLPKNERLPIFSHWGVSGGDFAEVVGPDIRKKIKLSFIQSSFSFLDKLNSFQQGVLEQAYHLFPEIISHPVDIKAPTGFIHAYDLTRLLIAAAEKVDMNTHAEVRRAALRSAFENLDSPIQGLIKTYVKPFSVFSETNPDAHEALGMDDFRMARFGAQNEIILLSY